MNYLTFFLGLVLFSLAVLDLLFTALSPTGAGFITGRLSKGLWKTFLFLSRKVGARRLLEMAGPLITGVLLINWLLLIWTACTIMIYSDEASVMNMETNTSASLISKIYFTGYTLSTMGNGDMEPGDGFWEFFTALFSFSGLILISIAISYLITLKTAFIEDTSEVPPFPNLTNFAKLNIPHTRDQTQIARHYAQWKKRRSTLLGLIQDDGWQWEDLDAGAYDHTFDHH